MRRMLTALLVVLFLAAIALSFGAPIVDEFRIVRMTSRTTGIGNDGERYIIPNDPGVLDALQNTPHLSIHYYPRPDGRLIDMLSVPNKTFWQRLVTV